MNGRVLTDPVGNRIIFTGTATEFAQLRGNIEQISRTMPMSPSGVASIVAAGARAGVARKELGAFASDAVKMGIAFDMTADEAGLTMATWRTAFKLGQSESAIGVMHNVRNGLNPISVIVSQGMNAQPVIAQG